MKIGTSKEVVTVNGDQINVNQADATVSTVIDRQFVENIPLNGRSLQNLLTIVPGVATVPGAGQVGYGGEITVNGQRTESNYFTVDGVSANSGAKIDNETGGAGFSGSVPGMTIIGTTQSMVSLDDLQEFRALTSTYSAEYGRTPGGQFALTTRSGTNIWHGSLFDYFRNDDLDATDFFNNYYGYPKTGSARTISAVLWVGQSSFPMSTMARTRPSSFSITKACGSSRRCRLRFGMSPISRMRKRRRRCYSPFSTVSRFRTDRNCRKVLGLPTTLSLTRSLPAWTA